MDTAVYWIEYIIRHKGALKLQSSAKYLAWYQYYLLDVIAVLVGIPLVLAYLLITLVRLLLKSTSTKSKLKTK